MNTVGRALRGLLKDPLVAVGSLLLLALGIGAFTAGADTLKYFSDPLPFSDAEGVVRIWSSPPSEHARGGLQGPDYLEIERSAHTLRGVGAFAEHTSTLGSAEEHRSVTSSSISPSALEALGAGALAGRLFVREDDRVGAARVCLVTRHLWASLGYQREPAIGQYLTVDGGPVLIIGVLPEDFDFPSPSTELWMPLETGPWGSSFREGGASFGVIGVLADGASGAQLAHELRTISQRLGEGRAPSEHQVLWAESLEAYVLEPVRPALAVLAVAVLFVLISTVLNLCVLQVGRSIRLERETAIQYALGASSWRVLRPRLIESTLLLGTALLIAIPLSRAFLKVLFSTDRFSGSAIPGGGAAYLAFATIVIAIASLSALIPFARTPASLPSVLSRSAVGRRHLRPWRRLTTLELASSFLFVVGAVFFTSTYRSVGSVDAGFDHTNLFAAYVRFPEQSYLFDPADPPTWVGHHARVARFLEAVRAVPGVLGAAVGTVHPVDPGWTAKYSVVGSTAPPISPQSHIRTRWVSDAYFDVAGVPVVAGREFEPKDALGSEAVALLNEQAAKRLFPGEDPIGRQVSIWNKTPRRIVGVVGDVHFLGIQQPVAPAIYAPYFQMPTGYFNATIKTQLPLSELRRHLQAALSGIDPALAVSDVWRLQDLVYRPLQPLRTGAVLATLLSTVLLAISVTGLYALTAASAAVGKPEFAVRMAFGARPRQIVKLVLVRGGRAVLVGTVVGMVLALAISRTLSFVYALGGGPTIGHLLIATSLTTLAALPALLAPALRAGIVAPFVTLKTE